MGTSLGFSSIIITLLCLFSNQRIKAQRVAEEGQLQEQELNRVLRLPGQPNEPLISQYSGYLTVNEERGRALFYWFFEAQTKPSEKPLLLWLSGGPGCSSIGFGEAVELGPLRVQTNGKGVEFNKFAWNKEANLLLLESPFGVGFSYTNTSSDFSSLDDTFVANDAYGFMVKWLKKFRQYQNNEFYISGESYAGHYVPQLAEVIYEHNKDPKKDLYINLKGFIVGNPTTDDYYDSKGFVDYAWSHSVISDQTYAYVNKVCDFKLVHWTKECSKAVDLVFREYIAIDIYNIYAPKCTTKQNSSFIVEKELNFQRKRDYFGYSEGYDPCFSNHVEEYFNRADVQRSLHVQWKPNPEWVVCRYSVLENYNFTVFSVLPIYSKLIKAGLRIWLYSGDTDGIVPVIGTRYCVESLDLPLLSNWSRWYIHNQVGGRFVEYQGLTMVTVRGAGHLVPFNKPEEALLLINSFLSGQSMPR
ncbi:hypothetical protein HPP92_016643 [Vanilla planifolia]|uniref:Carboxypeptidase n=1 Tax=Vanilla planifolia TaxID=51239 RepID=A0A835QNK4_VANPL|nr:hypothetical protein HPP92_016643 [Vanilla planifolia]